MSYRVIWTKEADTDLETIIEYYLLEASLDVALSVSGRIQGVIASLSEFPLRTREGRVTGTRECVIHGLPYIGILKVDSDTVSVISILHTARNYP
jgi:toxin ParE1/3/4